MNLIETEVVMIMFNLVLSGDAKHVAAGKAGPSLERRFIVSNSNPPMAV